MEQSSRELDSLRVHKSGVSDTMEQQDWAKKRLVWIPHPDHGFESASLKGEQSDKYVVELQSGKRIAVEKDDIQKMNPPRFEKAEDMAELTWLNEASVLHNIRERFFSNLIYTYSGLFCVVVNPYKMLPIYTDKIVSMYKGKKRHEMPPHVYAIADASYRSMLTDREDQAILCTGESGAGKTENTKKVIQYIAGVAASSNKGGRGHMPGELEAQLLQANPILEAFGNAKTVKNDNSSRFGKFIRINFDASGYIAGANVESYLLEKARVIRQAPNERTFHIFYQLVAGATDQYRRELLLEDFSNYRYLTNGKVPVPNTNDGDEFHETLKAMKIMNIPDDDTKAMLRVISACLLFGNLQFAKERNSEQAVLPNDTVAQKLSHLLGISLTDFTKALLRPKIKVGREFVTKGQTKEQVEYSVEAISKALYERLFKWLVQRINKSLDRTTRQGASFIGILDIAGFEIFQVNSFEQLCINYTNEKLQQLFNHTMFILEQEEYQREGIEWRFIDFGLDLQPCIDLIECAANPPGILALLDEECWFPKATDKSFVEKLHAQQNRHLKFIPGKKLQQNLDFSIFHYAGQVGYKSTGWLTKNMDPLNDHIVSLLHDSKDTFIHNLWRDVSSIVSMGANMQSNPFGARTGPKKGMFRTVSALYKEQLGKLMSTLRNTNPNFVRCIIPNYEKRPGKLDGTLILDQLKCNGVLEGIRICRQGFPNRIPFQEFRTRYEILCPHMLPKGILDGKKAAQIMLNALELDSGLYKIGQSKVFFRAGVLASLEEERDFRLTAIMVRFQAYCRGYLARQNFIKRKDQLRAIRIIQRNGFAYLKLRNWEWWRLFTKVKPLLDVTKQSNELNAVNQEMQGLKEEHHHVAVENKELQKNNIDLIDNARMMEAQLQDERESTERAENVRMHLERQLEACLENVEDLEHRINSEIDATSKFKDERDSMRRNFEAVEAELDEVQASKQKLQLEKVGVDAKVKQMTDAIAQREEQLTKYDKNNKKLVSKIDALNQQLSSEGDKAKGLSKQKMKYEHTIQETEERLRREESLRQELEKAKRRLEQEIAELQEQLQIAHQRIEQLQSEAIRRDDELHNLRGELDQSVHQVSSLTKSHRELQTKVEELQEDLDASIESKRRAERQKRDKEEELEALKTELSEQSEAGKRSDDILRSFATDTNAVKAELHDATERHASEIHTMRTKNAQQVTVLQDELDAIKRHKLTIDRNKDQLQTQVDELTEDLRLLASSRNDAEHKRRRIETSLQEALSNIQAYKTEMIDMEQARARQEQQLETSTLNVEELEQRLNEATKNESEFQSQVMDLTAAIQDEKAQKARINSRNRQLQEEIAKLENQNEDEILARETMQRSIDLHRQAAEEGKKKADDLSRQIEDTEDIINRIRKENHELENKLSDMASKYDRSEKTKKRITAERDDIQVELDQVRSDTANTDRLKKQHDRMVADMKSREGQLLEERDTANSDLRQAQERINKVLNEKEELLEEYQKSEITRKALQDEYDNIIDNKNEKDRSAYELQRSKKQLDQQVAELKNQLEELEDELQLAEDNNMRMEVTIQALKKDHDRELQHKDEEADERRKALKLTLRDKEAELEEEARQRANAILAKNKLDSQISELVIQSENASKTKEDALRQFRRLQQQMREIERENEEYRKREEEGSGTSKEAMNKVRNLEAQLVDLQEEVQQALRAKRLAEGERDEASEELVIANREKGTAIDERRRTDQKLSEMEEERDELEGELESSHDRMQQLQILVETKDTELLDANSRVNKLETAYASQERLTREIRSQKEELEAQVKTRYKTQLANMEMKLQAAQEGVDQEQKEKTAMQRQIRRAERRLREQQAQHDDTQKIIDGLKDEVEREKRRAITLRRNNDELEESSGRNAARLRRVQRELDEAQEENEKLNRETTRLRTQTRRTERSGRRTYFSKSPFNETIDSEEDVKSQSSSQQAATSLNNSGAGDQYE